MRKFIAFILGTFLFTQVAIAQSQYEVSRGKNGEKILKGIISRDLLENDTAFKWYAVNSKGYTPHDLAVSAIKNYGDSIRLIVFMGTWCEDSHVIIPRLFNLLDAAAFSRERISLIGADRQKKTLGFLAEGLNIINVPTILIMKNGKEVGRIVEYGRYGIWDKELGELINAAFKS